MGISLDSLEFVGVPGEPGRLLVAQPYEGQCHGRLVRAGETTARRWLWGILDVVYYAKTMEIASQEPSFPGGFYC